MQADSLPAEPQVVSSFEPQREALRDLGPQKSLQMAPCPPLRSCGLLVGSDLLCTTLYPGQLSEDALAGLGGRSGVALEITG